MPNWDSLVDPQGRKKVFLAENAAKSFEVAVRVVGFVTFVTLCQAAPTFSALMNVWVVESHRARSPFDGSAGT